MSCPTPKLARDWIGRRVRLLVDLRTNAGWIFKKGSVMRVRKNFAGLGLEPIRRPRKPGHLGITGVSAHKVRLLPKRPTS